MLLIWSWGPAFWTVRAAKRGSRRLSPGFESFAREFEQEYGFAPLWVDVTPDDRWQPEGSCLLTIVADRSSQCAALSIDGDTVPRASVTRDVRNLFQRTCPDMSVRVGVGLSRRRIEARTLRVMLFSFERVAVEKAHNSVRLRDFEDRLGIGEQFWCTASGGTPPVVFVHTEAQAAAIRSSSAPERWADLWYALVTPHDEFGYITRESIEIRVDSKQNFEERFKGDWRLYET